MNAIQRALTVADPDLQVIGGGHPEPEIRRGPGFQKIVLALRTSVWSKGWKGAESLGPLPWIRHWFVPSITWKGFYHVKFPQSTP